MLMRCPPLSAQQHCIGWIDWSADTLGKDLVSANKTVYSLHAAKHFLHVPLYMRKLVWERADE